MPTHEVTVTPEGSFEPRKVRIQDGDTVVWKFASKLNAIIPVDRDGDVPVARPYDPEDSNDFTGPFPRLVPGVHCINQPIETTEAGDESLPPWVWKEPGFNCVYIRLNWQLVNPAPGVYDWEALDAHMDAAVASGKYFGLSIRAGVQETPEWLFDARLGDQKCKPVKLPYIKRTLGLPQDPNYQHWWFECHRALADHVRSNNTWWQRLTAVRVAGANHHSAEASLPTTTADNPKTVEYNTIWKDAGYTAEGIYEYFKNQGDLFLEVFSGKDIGYPLIQNGFPPDGSISGVDQTVEVIQRGRQRWGSTWFVQHLGLQALRNPPNKLPYSDSHPVENTRGVKVGDGNPNQWCLRAGIQGSPTAGQTVNRLHETTNGLERALLNAWDNSDYLWVEVYARDVWPSYEAGSGSIGELGFTLAEWSQRFAEWRTQRWNDELGPAFPMEHSHTFTRTQTDSEPQRLLYVLSGDTDARGVVESSR